MEWYRRQENVTGLDVLAEFKMYDVFSYLEEVYDILHTQSMNYIIDEIKIYIEERK
jgi:hypothetical protein